MRIPGRALPRATAIAVIAALAVAACSGDDDADQAGSTPAPTVAPTSQRPAATSGPSVPGPTPTSGTPPTSPATSTTAATTIAPVPETGVPGLDAEDALCRAWSRFAGSFQVVAVAASFGGDDEQALALEAVAASTVVAAHDELLDNLPSELDGERDVVADQLIGPFAERARQAYDALLDAGADESMIATIEDAWLAALAARDPAEPTVAVDLPEEVWSVVDAAVAALGAELVPVPADPDLVTDVSAPLTEQYLADTCPDRGTLIGEDVAV